MDNPLNSPVVRAIANAAADGTQKAAEKPNAMNPAAVAQSRSDVLVEVAKAVEPVLEHVTNNEPWYQSRVTLGSLGTIVTSGLAIWGLVANGLTDVQLLSPPIIAIATASLALYGRWAARKPLGS
jgi:hypothetical protein